MLASFLVGTLRVEVRLGVDRDLDMVGFDFAGLAGSSDAVFLARLTGAIWGRWKSREAGAI